MADNGWIKLHRKISEHWLWNEKPFSKGQAWIDLVMLANHAQGIVIFRDETIRVERGQHITSELKLGEQWGWSRGRVKRFLNALQTDSMVNIKQDNRKCIITICNYRIYQSKAESNDTTETQQTGQQTGQQTVQQAVQQTDTNKNNKNSRSKEYIHTAKPTLQNFLNYSAQVGFTKEQTENAYAYCISNNWLWKEGIPMNTEESAIPHLLRRLKNAQAAHKKPDPANMRSKDATCSYCGKKGTQIFRDNKHWCDHACYNKALVPALGDD